MNSKYFEAKLKKHIGASNWGLLRDVGAMIAGGAVHSIVTDGEIKDLDVYFRSAEDCLAAVEEFRVKSKSIKYITDRSLTFKDGTCTFQFIYFNFYYDVHAIFKEFDFSVCMGAYDFKYEQLITHQDFYPDIASKTISINSGTCYPLISLNRVIKYSKKGYNFPLSSFLELCKGINRFDYNDEAVIKDQTSGFYGITSDVPFQYEPDDIPFLVQRKGYRVFEYDGELYDCVTLGKVGKPKTEMPVTFVKVPFGGTYFYKHVELWDGELRSFYNRNFKYKLGEYAEGSSGAGLWGYNTKVGAVETGMYHNKKDAVLIKIFVETLDDLGIGKRFQGDFLRGKVVKVYSKEESPTDDELIDLILQST